MVRIIWVTVFCLLAIGALALQHDYLRVDGADTPITGEYVVVCDSTDSFYVDTVYSDTVNIESYTYLHYFIGLTGYNLADSSNDSVLIFVSGYGLSEGRFPTLMFTDTINNGTGGALDSSTVQVGVERVDSTAYNSMYLRTIIQDSFVRGNTGNDTNKFRFLYQVSQSMPTVR